MSFLQSLTSFLEIFVPENPGVLTNADRDQIALKHDSDKAAEMEFIMERETDPLIQKKLEWRLNSGVYEWDDLYQK